MIELSGRYRHKGALIDTNILLLYVIGSFRRDLIGGDRVEKFVDDDFVLLQGICSYFKRLVTTPNILSEVNNLVPNWFGVDFFEMFSTHITVLEEVYVPSREVVQHRAFRTVGLTDASVIQAAAKGPYLVITDDWTLRQFLEDARIDTLNFEELRFQNWKRR